MLLLSRKTQQIFDPPLGDLQSAHLRDLLHLGNENEKRSKWGIEDASGIAQT